MKRIMVVDDDEDVLFLLKSGLEREGYEVLEVKSGEECVSKVDEFNPDFILMDIIMPGINGWEACRQVKMVRNSIPVCMLSVRRDEEDIKKSLEYALADCHLPKPVDFDKIIAKINEIA